MEFLLTLPSHFASFIRKNKNDYPAITAVFSDPENMKLGSGGGSVNVLWQHYLTSEKAFGVAKMSTRMKYRIGANKWQNGENSRAPENSDSKPESFFGWLGREKRIIIHSDGQSRRLPAYSAIGKSFIPFPVFKWGRGQSIRQALYDIQRPLLEKIMSKAPAGLNTMIVSGDALVYFDSSLPEIPEADVVCLGAWTQPEVASKHGVFICPRHDPTYLEYMLQKPSIESIQSITNDYLYLLDTGIWLLSDKAVRNLFKLCGFNEKAGRFSKKEPGCIDLYTDFARQLDNKGWTTELKQPAGSRKTGDPDQHLECRIFTISGAEFYHFGSNSDLLKSTTALHNRVTDQREIWHKKIKPSEEIFVQDSVTGVRLGPENSKVWIDSSFIPQSWKLNQKHILSGIPENNWDFEMPEGICLDFVPIGETKWCIRFYGYNDNLRGKIDDPMTSFLNRPAMEWFEKRGIPWTKTMNIAGSDIYEALIFPVVDEQNLDKDFIQWLLNEDTVSQKRFSDYYIKCRRLSSVEIQLKVNHKRRQDLSDKLLKSSLQSMANNFRQSIFYQLDLNRLVNDYIKLRLPLPAVLPEDAPLMPRVHDAMFRAVYSESIKLSLQEVQYRKETVKKPGGQSTLLREKAFSLLRQGMIGELNSQKPDPVLNIQPEQIIWGRSPVRLDLAGGWTDTPPYCILNGGRVVNLAVELNGQPPLQVFIRPKKEAEIVIRSIDLGVSEVIRSYNDLDAVLKVGSAFSIPKAALMLSGFHPGFSDTRFISLKEQLKNFGGGFDISLMVAVPKGSGLGTSSILAASLFGVLSEFCKLGWDRHELANRTLILEQILTTGGGWQDQYGGIFEGVKFIESSPGFAQKPSVKWATDSLFTDPLTKQSILLYYTGINRIAKKILQDIVQGMFLNSSKHLEILSEMRLHALATYDSLQNHDWNGLCRAVGRSWDLNCMLDSGTNTMAISEILKKIEDYMFSCKLLGAGGGGYLMIFAKNEGAAGKIRSILQKSPPNPGARFVGWELSRTGFQLSKS